MIRPDSPRIEAMFFETPEAMYAAAAENMARLVTDAIARTGAAVLALPGGSTPLPLYDLLAAQIDQGRVPWEKAHIFWGDERMVERSDHLSNHGEALRRIHSSLGSLSRVPTPVMHFPPVPPNPQDPCLTDTILGRRGPRSVEVDGQIVSDSPARLYGADIYGTFALLNPSRASLGPETRVHGSPDTIPAFDLILLGMGEDGHVASIFPGSPLLQGSGGEPIEITAMVEAPPGAPCTLRMTFTLTLINAAREVWIMSCGKKKGEILELLLKNHGPGSKSAPDFERVGSLPVAAVAPTGCLKWYHSD